jgi:hypothetical protein
MVADWLDIPGAVVKKTLAVPLRMWMDSAAGAASGGAEVPSLADFPGFARFEGTL